MWMCRAVLAEGKVCETTNFDTADSCANCNAPRQANEALETHDELETLIDTAKHAAELGREKFKQYAPVANAVAQTAKDRAHVFAMHGNLATHTGIHMAGVVSFSLVLLTASILLPVLLGWPLTLTVTQRSDNNLAVGQMSSDSAPEGMATPGDAAMPDAKNDSLREDLPANQTHLYQNSEEQTQKSADGQVDEASSGDHPSELQGSLTESRHLYSGSERVIVFTPKELTDPRKNQIQFAAFLAGPLLISGTPVTLYGRGTDESGAATKGNISLELTNGHIFWFSAVALLLLLLIADLMLGDIYAMQKVLFSLEVTWILYSLVLSWIASNYMKDFVAKLFPGLSMDLTLSQLMTAPIKIAFIGLIYWMGSMLLRSLHQERTAAKAEKMRLAELDTERA